MAFRINFNGQQVVGPFKTYAEAKREILAMPNIGSETWIQERLDGDWFSNHMKPERKRPHLYRDQN